MQKVPTIWGTRVTLSVALVLAAFVISPAPEALSGTYATFRSACDVSHFLRDDPIVFPGQPGASHLHDFFGNTTTDAFSTYDSLREGQTTCDRPGDTAAYWIPAVYLDGSYIKPTELGAYYRGGNKEMSTIQAPPAGLRIIAGDAHASRAQDKRIVRWECDWDVLGTDPTTTECSGGSAVHLRLTFPDCWEGQHLDSPDHKAHMAYSQLASNGGDNVCPASHPVPLPQLELNITYPGVTGPGWSLASGSPNTAHADFINAWDQENLEDLVETCLRSGLGAGTGIVC